MSAVEVKVPDIGDLDEVSVIELLVKVGDTVKQGSVVLTLEGEGGAAVPPPQPSPSGGRESNSRTGRP